MRRGRRRTCSTRSFAASSTRTSSSSRWVRRWRTSICSSARGAWRARSAARASSATSRRSPMATAQTSSDPAQSAKVFAEVAERSGRLMGEFLQRQAEGKGLAYSDEFGVGRAFSDLAARMLAEPWKLAEMQTRMFWDHVALWQATALRMLGARPGPVAEPTKGDHRFREADWQDLFLFDYIKQSYLIAARHLQETVASVEGLPEETRKKVAFYTRQYVDALSPSNFALTNPQVLRETLQSGGQNLLRGLN